MITPYIFFLIFKKFPVATLIKFLMEFVKLHHDTDFLIHVLRKEH